jgi:hypothetical protein
VDSATASTSEPWSLQRRLRNHLWLAIAALWLVGSGLALFVQWRETNELLDSAQAETARLALNLPMGQLDATERLGKANDNNVYIQVFDAKGELVWRSAMAPKAPMAALSGDAVSVEHGRRVLVRQDTLTHRTAIVSASLYDRQEALSGATEAFLMPLFVLLPLTALTLTWLLRKAFSPVDAMRAMLEDRHSNELVPLPSTGLSLEFNGRRPQPVVREAHPCTQGRSGFCRQQRPRAAHPHRGRPSATAAFEQRAQEWCTHRGHDPAHRHRGPPARPPAPPVRQAHAALKG